MVVLEKYEERVLENRHLRLLWLKGYMQGIFLTPLLYKITLFGFRMPIFHIFKKS